MRYGYVDVGPRVRGTRVVGSLYFLSRRSREVYSEVAPRRPASMHVGARSALHGDYHIACHIVGAPHEGEEMEEKTKKKRMRKRRANERWQRHRMEERTRRMWTLTALQYTQGHGVYKPPQFYLHPSSARITLAAGIKPFIVLQSGRSCLQPSILLIFASGSLFLPRRPHVKVPFFSSSISPVLIVLSESPSAPLLILRSPFVIPNTSFPRRSTCVSTIGSTVQKMNVLIDDMQVLHCGKMIASC